MQEISAITNAITICAFAVCAAFAFHRVMVGTLHLSGATRELLWGMIKVSIGVIYLVGFWLAAQIVSDYDPETNAVRWVIEWRWTRIFAALLISHGVVRMIYAVWSQPIMSRITAWLIIVLAGSLFGLIV